MPTVFDRTRKKKFQVDKPLETAHGVSNATHQHIYESSFDLKDAAKFTFDRGSKAARKMFADVPIPQLRHMLDNSNMHSYTSGNKLTVIRNTTRSRANDHRPRETTLNARGATRMNYLREPTTCKVKDHMNAATMSQLQPHDYDYVRINSTAPHTTTTTTTTTATTPSTRFKTTSSWRTSNPMPGMGEFRQLQATDTQTGDALHIIEQEMKKVGRINYMQFAPDLIPSKPLRKKKCHTTTSSNYGGLVSRGKKTQLAATCDKQKVSRTNRSQRKKQVSLTNVAEHPTTTIPTIPTTTSTATAKKLNKIEQLQQKKKDILQRKIDKVERKEATLKLQAVARGRRVRRMDQQKKNELCATFKIQAIQRGRKGRRKAQLLKQKLHQEKQETEASKKIQSIHRGKKDRRKVQHIKQTRKEEHASLKIQSIHRGKKDRRKVQTIKADRIATLRQQQNNATLKIQSIQRGKIARKKAAVKKKHLQKMHRLHTVDQKERDQLHSFHAVRIQSVFRMYLAAEEYQDKLHAIKQIQACMRMYIAREDYEDNRHVLMSVQAVLRGAMVRRMMARMKMKMNEAKEAVKLSHLVETKSDAPDAPTVDAHESGNDDDHDALFAEEFASSEEDEEDLHEDLDLHNMTEEELMAVINTEAKDSKEDDV